MVREGQYIIPYSSHSNYIEIELFVSSIRPSVLRTVNRLIDNSIHEIHASIDHYHQYRYILEHISQRGYSILMNTYTDIDTSSIEYRNNVLDVQNVSHIHCILCIDVCDTSIHMADDRLYRSNDDVYNTVYKVQQVSSYRNDNMNIKHMINSYNNTQDNKGMILYRHNDHIHDDSIVNVLYGDRRIDITSTHRTVYHSNIHTFNST